jgi:hypothetical protein
MHATNSKFMETIWKTVDNKDHNILLWFEDLITITVVVPILQDIKLCSLAKSSHPRSNIPPQSPEKGMPQRDGGILLVRNIGTHSPINTGSSWYPIIFLLLRYLDKNRLSNTGWNTVDHCSHLLFLSSITEVSSEFVFHGKRIRTSWQILQQSAQW